jgi:SAM-dependent methyltransferase
MLTQPERPAAPEADRDELARIRQTYEQRQHAIPADRYSRTNPGHLYALQEREATMAALLRSSGLRSLAGLRILDVGCGRGATLRQYLEYDADPSGLWGIDLLPAFARTSHSLSPHLRVACASAAQLPFSDGTFDLVSHFMLFTSVLSFEMKRQIAHEIHRVLVRGGRFLWYDFAYDNPKNRDVKGIKLQEIQRLFPGFAMVVRRRVTVAPPLGRFLGRFGPSVYYLASQLRVLNTHYFCLLRKK